MPILNSDPWFGRGQTLGVNSAEQGGAVVGSQKVFTDADPRFNNASQFLSNRPVTCIAVRNTSGAALLPGAVVKFKPAAILEEVDGAAATATGLIGVVDEYLPASGVADKDVFWVVVSGPVAITTSATLAAGAAITAAAGKAAASAAATDIVGYAISAPASGKVRAIVGTAYGHSAY
jgi:hypothetical protein